MKKLGLYIHIPFCVKKCSYCDFLSFENTDFELHRQYVNSMKRELAHYERIYGREFSVDTIFIGGGTPSLIDANLIWEILLLIKENINVDKNAEITLECNPKTVNKEKLEIYKRAGVNRLSIGVQSLEDAVLKRLGRVHNEAEALETFKMARDIGFKNINLDLMFAAPEHTMKEWKDTIEKAVKLKPEHISFYSLQLEEGTRFFEMFEKNELKLISDELDRHMYHYAAEAFKEAGYEHYEISNCAQKGFECRHNLKYWSVGDYLGVGIGAHSYINGERFSNTKDINKYMEELRSDVADDASGWVEWQHSNTEFDDMAEFVITGMRKLDGISLLDFHVKFGRELFEAYPEQKKIIDDYAEKGCIILEGDRLMFTGKGIDISNAILAEFV